MNTVKNAKLDELSGDRSELVCELVLTTGCSGHRESAAGRGKVHTPHAMMTNLMFKPAPANAPAEVAMLTVP